MIYATYMVVSACILVGSALTKDNYCKEVDTVYQKLEWAEMMIKSAKEKVSSNRFPMDCEDLLQNGEKFSGVYQVWPKNRLIEGSISVYCDMDTDGGGWTVIQRRGNFSRDTKFFYQDWKAYKDGFGNLKEEFWLGNDKIYGLSNQKKYSIRFDLTAPDGSTAYALYDTFWIDDENNNYQLHVADYSGNAGDSFSSHSGYNFTTKDRDNDVSNNNCAQEWDGAWWFKSCFDSHLNGIYHEVGPPEPNEGLQWYEWKGKHISLKWTEMKIRKFPTWGK